MAADAHAVQGDGEVSIAAAETYFEEVELQFVVRKDMKPLPDRRNTDPLDRHGLPPGPR